jgi:cell division transport system permease protein
MEESRMDLNSALTRARRGLREELRLYLVAISSLAVAFLCLASMLLALSNLDVMADRWGRSGKLTIYLADGIQAADMAQLRVILEGLGEVEALEHVSSAEAKAEFLAQTDAASDFEDLAPEVFPASLEVTLASGTSAARAQSIATRLAELRGVSDVESYRGFFDRLESLLDAAHGMSLALALLVGLCVVTVIGNTIRLAVARRHREIEVMKLCGATDGFVRGPFVLEGAFQGFAAAVIALVVLGVTFGILAGRVDETLAALAGVQTVFLSPGTVLAILFGGGLIGALGSALSVRRYLAV